MNPASVDNLFSCQWTDYTGHESRTEYKKTLKLPCEFTAAKVN